MELLTINDAAQLSGKSIQTIRRIIKQKKVQVKKQKTPQGFNYLVIKESLLTFLAQNIQPTNRQAPDSQEFSREHRPLEQTTREEFKAEIERFTVTIQRLLEQNSKDKENFFHLIKTFQDRVVVLESEVRLLSAPKKSWWRFW